jgi:mono/diheme cytochrome c family protein
MNDERRSHPMNETTARTHQAGTKVVLALALLTSACAARADESSSSHPRGAKVHAATGAAPHEGADGAAIYQQYCSVCHGDRGDGESRASGSLKPPPRDFTTPRAAGELSRERMIASVTKGVPGTAMTGWDNQLDTHEIAAVVDHIRSNIMLASIGDDTDPGRKVYAEYCSVCHGDRGDGVSRASGSLIPSPRNFTNALAARELSRDRMIASVTYGRANTAMPPWETQLSKDDIAATVDFIRSTFMPEHDEAEATPTETAHGGHEHVTLVGDLTALMAAPLPDGLHGDAEWGKRFYDDNCAECHGVKGDGQGRRAYFIFPKPRDFGHPAARAELNRPHLFEAISKGSVGTEMAAWDKVLSDEELAGVTEHVFRTFIRPDAADAPALDPHGHGASAEHGDAHSGPVDAHADTAHGDGSSHVDEGAHGAPAHADEQGAHAETH